MQSPRARFMVVARADLWRAGHQDRSGMVSFTPIAARRPAEEFYNTAAESAATCPLAFARLSRTRSITRKARFGTQMTDNKQMRRTTIAPRRLEAPSPIATATMKRFFRPMYAAAIAAFAVGPACSDGASIGSEGESASDPGAISGELVAYIADFGDGTSRTDYALRADDGTEIPLKFAEAPSVRSGQRIRIRGIAGAGGIAVTSYTLDASGSRAETLIGVAKAPSHNMAVLLVDIGGGYTGPSIDAVEQQFFQGPKSVNAFYGENSYGKNGLNGAVFGPFTYALTACSNTDMNDMAKALKPMVGGTYDQYGYIFPNTSLCSWSGLGAVGDPSRPAHDTWYNGSIGCVVTVQEPGHNYGMQHSSSMTCPKATFVDAPDGTCTHNEYGDTFDPMGGGCRHMNVWQKEYEQWLGGCNSVKVTESGTFYLLPTELACDGIQAIQIPMPKSRTFSHSSAGSTPKVDTLTSYYLEYRTPAGFDQGLTPTVLLHVGGDYRAQNQSGLHTWLLNMHPGMTGRNANFGFTAGQSFTDPAGGVTITVTDMDAQKATVQIDIDNTVIANGAPPSCLDGSTLEPPGPITCSAAPVEIDTSAITADAGAPRANDAGPGTSGSATGSTGIAGSTGTSDSTGIAGSTATGSVAGSVATSSDSGATAGMAETGSAGATGAGATGGDATGGGATQATSDTAGQATSGLGGQATASIGASGREASSTASSDEPLPPDPGVRGSCGCKLAGASPPSKHGIPTALGLTVLAFARLRRGSRSVSRRTRGGTCARA